METKGNTARNGLLPCLLAWNQRGRFYLLSPSSLGRNPGEAGRGSQPPGYPPPPSGKAASIQWLRQKDTKVAMRGARLAK